MKKPIEIIDYTSEYKEDFADINREWLKAYFVVEPIDEEIFTDPESYILKPGGYIFMARMEGEIVGTCAIIKTGENEYEMAKMGVRPAAQGFGVGRKLAEACIAKVREIGVPKLELMTNSKLTPAITLYQSLGFRITHQGPHAKYTRTDTIMSLNLKEKVAA